MPESGAIERTRDAMNAWLRMDLPADFDQLRADLRHILGCIPATHQRMPNTNMPDGITAEACRMDCHWVFTCNTCEWAMHTGVALGPAGTPLHDQLADHAATHQEPPC